MAVTNKERDTVRYYKIEFERQKHKEPCKSRALYVLGARITQSI